MIAGRGNGRRFQYGRELFRRGAGFFFGGSVEGLPVSQSYLNYMGTWAYSMKCPIIKNGQEIATLYVEYIYDSLDESLPNGFYNGRVCSILWTRRAKGWC